MMYAPSRSSFDEPVKRNENGFRRKLRNRTTTRFYGCASEVRKGASVRSVKRWERASAVFAERVLEGVDDAGASERVVIWIERKPGALWAVGRAVNPQHR